MDYGDGECSTSSAPIMDEEVAANPRQDPQDLQCDSLEELLIFNETYVEIIDNQLAQIDWQLSENKSKQTALIEERKIYKKADVTKRKVPVHLYMPPYFKDENGMCPPMSAEARTKQEQKWFDPLMKEEKKWTPSEVKTLREAVKDAMIIKQMQPLSSRRDILVSKLRSSDITTASWERRVWTSELEEIMRNIEYIKTKDIDEVLTVAADYSMVPWNEIANVDFKGTRTEWAVRAKWMNELNPKWSKLPWSATEVESLRALRESPNFVSWVMLALKLGTNRTAFQCMEKYKTEIAQHSREWTQDEDTKLIALTKLTSINGHIQWDKVAQFMPGRTRQQVRTRFSHTLDASIKHGRWTDQEDMLLMCAVSRHGAKDWAKIAQAVQNRNDSQCRERWTNVLNRSAHVKERFTLAEDEQLLYAVKVFGKGNWAKCASLLPKKTARQIRRRYVQLIAAKLRLVAGFSTATMAMKAGCRLPDEEELVEEDNEASAAIPNELMVEIYEKLAVEKPGMNESPEEFYKRVNELEQPVSARLRMLKNRPDYAQIKDHIDEIVERHQKNEDDTEVNKELAASNVLSSLTITETDVRYMIERSKTMSRYYQARKSRRNVDQAGCRIRPLRIEMDPGLMPVFEEDTPEEEKIMRLVEALCSSIRRTDLVSWGKQFWMEHRHVGAKLAKRYTENMICNKSMELVNWRLSPDTDRSAAPPPKTTLPPSNASFNMLKILQKARTGLSRLAAEHFYPVDVSLEKQNEFSNDDREQLDEKRRLNIRLADEVTDSKQYNVFLCRMRSILLEPMRLEFSRESPADERDRLRREIDMEARCSEEEAVVAKVISSPFKAPNPPAPPTSICQILHDGIKIDTSTFRMARGKIDKKRRIEDIVELVSKRGRRDSASTSHHSIDTEFSID